jgi:hypothetical protein
MDNKTMARLLAETADLLEIAGADSFRIRSYRRAADAAEQTTVNLTEACCRPSPPLDPSISATSCWPNTAPAFSNCSNFPAWAPKPLPCSGMRPK